MDVNEGTLYVDPTNNRVGIGTTDPKEKLHVEGNIYVEGNISGFTDSLIRVARTESSSGGVSVTVHCPSGYKVIGGGCSSSSRGPVVYNNYPNTDASWSCSMWTQIGSDMGHITAYAICAPE
jgi:hypothetical protein